MTDLMKEVLWKWCESTFLPVRGSRLVTMSVCEQSNRAAVQNTDQV